MPDYAKMYRLLFNSQTDAIALQEQVMVILKKAKQATEEIYVARPSRISVCLNPKGRTSLRKNKQKARK